ncbi:MAG: OprO/OprP family phosphate-selective porin [Bacteroides sp.]|nr:OprO/OprP family phosphate-selective porin [Bacteroides sp.]MCM1085809.1 OprO/OprP family phosphate-selective porin [Bacteroides sp.]
MFFRDTFADYMKRGSRLFATVALALASGTLADAQEQESEGVQAPKKQPISIHFNVRVDWENHLTDMGDSVAYKSAFSGQYINFMLNGNINDQFSYHFRYRFNRVTSFSSFFDAVDWAYLDYDITPNWRVSAGKQMVYIGGFEYDYAPIDVYFWSGANENITCYGLGVSGQYTTNDGRNTIVAQITNSPFTSREKPFQNMYAYNLAWYGNYGVYRSIWSVNMMNYAKGKFVNYIALGNRFNIAPFLAVELDYVNRYYLGQGSFFGDFSIIGNLIVNIKERANIFVKGGFDYNKTGNDDILVGPLAPGIGGESGYIGAGAEFFPLKKSKDIRLHAYWATNNRVDDFKSHTVAVGFTWLLRAFDRQ